MALLFLIHGGNGAHASEPPPTLASLIKHGLMTGIEDRGKVRVVEVRLFQNVIAMPQAELEAKLAGKEPFPVGILETKDHGRLRVSCLADRCTAGAGDVSLTLQLVRELPPPEGTGARRKPPQ